MNPLSFVTILIVAYGLLNKKGYQVALAIGGVTASGAAYVAGRLVVPTFYAAAVCTAVILAAAFLVGRSGGRRPPPGVPLLIAFFLYTFTITLCAPLLFNGLAVTTPGADRLVAGHLTTSNFAQIAYLLLGICVVTYLARQRFRWSGLIGVTVVGATMVSFWRLLYVTFGFPFPEGLFDNSPVFAYIESAPGNVARFRGIFSEPAGLASSSLATIAWAISGLASARARGALFRLFVAALAVFLGLVSTSTTFVVAGVLSLVLATLVAVGSFTIHRLKVKASAAAAALILLIVLILAAPAVIGFVQEAVSAKLGTSSYNDRSNTNTLLYQTLVDTFGLGAGLGSGRASSFIATLAGTTGVVGTALFVAAVVLLVRQGARLTEYRPVAWTLLVLLVTKSVSGPDLSDSTGVLWICLGLLSQSVLIQREQNTPAGQFSPVPLPAGTNASITRTFRWSSTSPGGRGQRSD